MIAYVSSIWTIFDYDIDIIDSLDIWFFFTIARYDTIEMTQDFLHNSISSMSSVVEDIIKIISVVWWLY